MTRTCPSCGAEATGLVCEYCGTKIAVKKVNLKDKAAGEHPSEIRVVPFTADKNQAISAARKIVNDIKREIDSDLSTIGRGSTGLSIDITSAKSYYIPANVLKDANKVKSLQCNCNQAELPRWFPTSISSTIWEKHARFTWSDDKEKELSRADEMVEVRENTPASSERFIVVEMIAYLPFWVVDGTMGEIPFSIFIFAGNNGSPIVLNVLTDGKNLKKRLRNLFNYNTNEVQAKRKKQKEVVNKELDKQERKSKAIAWIILIIGLVVTIGGFLLFLEGEINVWLWLCSFLVGGLTVAYQCQRLTEL